MSEGEKVVEQVGPTPEPKGKWGVLLVLSDDVYEPVCDGLQYQEDAEKWIKDNIRDGQKLIAARLAKTYEVETKRRVFEVE